MKKSSYETSYSPNRFWKKLGPRARSLGRGTLEKALYLYYAVQNEHTPKWAKRVIYGALGYFIFPLDAIPDLAPLIGYTDDLSVMTAALATVAFYITHEVKAQARQKLEAWCNDTAATAYQHPEENTSA